MTDFFCITWNNSWDIYLMCWSRFFSLWKEKIPLPFRVLFLDVKWQVFFKGSCLPSSTQCYCLLPTLTKYLWIGLFYPSREYTTLYNPNQIHDFPGSSFIQKFSATFPSWSVVLFLSSPHIVCSTSMGNKRVEGGKGGGIKRLSVVQPKFLGRVWNRESVHVYVRMKCVAFTTTPVPRNTLGTRWAIVGADNNGLWLKHQAICLVEYTFVSSLWGSSLAKCIPCLPRASGSE